jgi:hypothetical protein
MTNPVESYDVFLSSAAADRGVAMVVRRAIEDRGLSVFSAENLKVGAPSEDVIRSAMADARVFVAVLSRLSVNSPSIAIELGAAMAWGKAIYLLLEGIGPAELPNPLLRYRSISVSKLADAIKEIERSIEPVTVEQAGVLSELYAAVGVSTEQLANRPSALDQLTHRFNERLGSSFSPERVLQELIRLRKRGGLPKLNRKTG